MSVSLPDAAREAARIEARRSALAQARGLGAARTGTSHWWAERLTSAALVPLSLWLVWFAWHLAGAPRAAVAHSVGAPANATLLLATVLVAFHHAQLGLQVVIEDYARARLRLLMLLAMQAAAMLLALACAVSVLRLAFTG